MFIVLSWWYRMDHGKGWFLLMRVRSCSLDMPWLFLLVWFPHLCLEYGMRVNELREIWLRILRSGGTWKSHLGFGFCIINEILSLCFSMRIILDYMWFIWMWFHGYFYPYYVGYVCFLWQQLCMVLITFYFYMNEKCVYGLMDGMVVNVLRHQCFMANLR